MTDEDEVFEQNNHYIVLPVVNIRQINTSSFAMQQYINSNTNELSGSSTHIVGVFPE